MAKRDFREKKEIEEVLTSGVDAEPVIEETDIVEEALANEDDVEPLNEKTFLKLKKQFSGFKLNVRKEASTSSEVIAQINNDDSIELVSDDINAEWYKAKVNNSIEGWVMSQYLEKSE
jgi:uncharacterized protein YgiM (DUF1202 family)